MQNKKRSFFSVVICFMIGHRLDQTFKPNWLSCSRCGKEIMAHDARYRELTGRARRNQVRTGRRAPSHQWSSR